MEEQERDADVAVKLETCLADNDDPARVQAMLEQTISPESQETVSAILQQVSRLSVAEKLLLYLRLPASRPDNSLQADRCSRGEMQRSVAWVRTHLAPQPAVSLPKQHVYREYTAFAARQGVKPVSSADFGKAVKAAFPDVRPRRLGVRGQSRYCYAGVGKATKLPAPSLPGQQTDWQRKRLCKRPSSDASEFVDFSTVALPTESAGQSRPSSITLNQSQAGQSRPGSVSQSRPPSAATSQSRPCSVQSRSASVSRDQSRPGSVVSIQSADPKPVDRRRAESNRTNRKPSCTGSTNGKPRRKDGPGQRFVPIGPSSSNSWQAKAAECVSPDLDAELLQYFAQPGPSLSTTPDDKLCRLRRVLQRSLEPSKSKPRTEHKAPTPPGFELWGPAAPSNPCNRGYLTAPPSPAPSAQNGRGYVTAPSSPLPYNSFGSDWPGVQSSYSRGHLTAPPSPAPVASNCRGYLTAPSSPNPYAQQSRGHMTAPPSPLPHQDFVPPSPCPVIGRGYATAPPSPIAWPMAAWRSRSVPPEPRPTPVPPTFRDFDATAGDDEMFGAWGGFQAFRDFELVCQPAELNAASELDMGLALGGQTLGLDGQELALEGQTLGLDGQELALNGQTLGLEDQALMLEGETLDMGSSQLFGAFRQSLAAADAEFGPVDRADLNVGQGGLEMVQGDLSLEQGSFAVAQPLLDVTQSQVIGGRQMAMDVVSYELSQGGLLPTPHDLPSLRVRCGRRQ